MASALADIVRALVERFATPRIDPLAFYDATVAAMNDDGTVDVKPDTVRFGAGLSRVPIRHGLPGVTRVRVARGARVRLGFAGGDVQQPFVSLWDAGTVEEITVEATTKAVVKAPSVYLADEEGAQPLARVGDLVELALPPLAPFSGTIAGSPATGLITFVDTAQGYITSGSDKANSA